METKTLDGLLFSQMLQGGASNLKANRITVNELNVFPVPDGDTGDNMYMTISSGYTAIKDTNDTSLDEIATTSAKGMLLGARGNSGVILSRIFAGIAKGFHGITTADAKALGHALECGINESYNAVSKPVEGTILTVYKDAVNFANSKITENQSLETYFNNLIEELKASLDRTPELLDVLKEAGVVDSGGAGFVYIAEGMNNALNGITSNISLDIPDSPKTIDISSYNMNTTKEFGYCTEFLLQLLETKQKNKDFDINTLITYLNENGNSVVAFREGSIVKVHVHTLEPGNILNYCQQYGEFLSIKIENMNLQHSETVIQNNYSNKKITPHKAYGIVTVASGDGIKNTFLELGADVVIEGGQSMNPSAEDFVKAFENINADTILVYPNNSNIILTAIQASTLYTNSKIEIVPTKTIGEGYIAMSMLDTSSNDINTIVNEANEIIKTVVTGHISKATRNTTQNHVEIVKDNYIGFSNDNIYSCNIDKKQTLIELCEDLNYKDYDIALLIQGIDSSDEETKEIKKELEQKYKRTELIIIKGMQPIYDYILVLE